VVSGRIPPEIAAALLRALDFARDHMPADQRGEGGPAGPPRTRGAINVDALAMMTELFMASQHAARDGGDRCLVGVNVDANVLVNDDPEGVCELDGGPALAPETARRLFCDSSTVAILRSQDRDLPAVSTRSRTVPRSARRAVHARDRGCRFPGCGERTFIDVHHVRHRARGGGHEISNLVELCWFHHRLVHEGGWTVRFLEHDEVIAITPNGNVISSALDAPARVGGTIEQRNRTVGVAVNEKTIVPRWSGDPLHLGEVVGGLEWLDERGDAASVSARAARCC
jgi:hypothetical protein